MNLLAILLLFASSFDNNRLHSCIKRLHTSLSSSQSSSPQPSLPQPSSLLDRLNHVSFGYERMNASSPTTLSSSSSSSSSLKTLCSDNNLDELPCLKDNSCPYIRFRCSKGHRWNAMPGTMTCLECPVCKMSSKKIKGFTENELKLPINEKLYPVLSSYCQSNNGTLITTVNEIKGWTSDIHIKCSKGHIFKSKMNNLVLGKNWCSKCREVDYDQTAALFNGKFLGLVGDDDDRPKRRRPAMWRCAEGHEFIEYVNNIRRSPKSKRKCSWCKVCKKKGYLFVYDGDKYKSSSLLSSSAVASS